MNCYTDRLCGREDSMYTAVHLKTKYLHEVQEAESKQLSSRRAATVMPLGSSCTLITQPSLIVPESSQCEVSC